MPRKYYLLLAVALSVVVLDQVTKYWVLGGLTDAFDAAPGVSQRLGVMFSTAPSPGYDGNHFRKRPPLVLSDSFFAFRYAENPGAAWGLFRNLPPDVRGPLFHVVSIGAVCLIGFYFSRLSGNDRAERWALWGLPLVLGGALGNYVDRLSRAFVVDFLEAHWFERAYWPSFNVADSAICIGVGMLVLDAIVRREKKEVKVVAGA